MKTILVVLLFAASANAQVRLSAVKAVYVASLGESAGAEMTRERLIASLSNSGRFRVVDSPSKADAQLVGRSETRARNIAAVWGGAAAANTVYDVLLVVRLMDGDSVIWAYDSQSDKKNKGATKTLLEAVEKDAKGKR